MTSDEIIARLIKQFGGDKVRRVQSEGCPEPHAVIESKILKDAATFLANDSELACTGLMTVSASDWLPEGEGESQQPGHIDVAYVFRSYKHNHRVTLKVVLDRNAPKVPSLAKLFPAADWHEREQYDLLGVEFERHPDLRRLMLPDDWQGHPLRKDYKQAPEWRGIPTTRKTSHERFRERLAAEEAAEKAETTTEEGAAS